MYLSTGQCVFQLIIWGWSSRYEGGILLLCFMHIYVFIIHSYTYLNAVKCSWMECVWVYKFINDPVCHNQHRTLGTDTLGMLSTPTTCRVCINSTRKFAQRLTFSAFYSVLLICVHLFPHPYYYTVIWNPIPEVRFPIYSPAPTPIYPKLLHLFRVERVLLTVC